MTVETGLAKLDSYTDGSGKRELEVADTLFNSYAIPGSLSYHCTEVKEEVYADVLERYKKLNKKLFWRVFALEGKSKH